MDISIESALIGAVVGSGMTGWTAYFIARHSIKKSFELVRLQDRNKAAATFRSAFTKEVYELNSIAHPEELDPDFVYNLIKENIIRHEIAYISFKPYLMSTEISAFDSAWRRYSNPSSIIKAQNPDPLLDYYAEGKTVEECIRLATAKIESLLGFAKPK